MKDRFTMQESISTYHERQVGVAVKHIIQPKGLSHDLGLGSELQQIWGSTPLVISTVKHPFMSPPSYHATGSALLRTLASQIGEVAEVHDVTWESFPKGMGDFNFGIGFDAIPIVSPGDIGSWESAKDKLLEQLKGLGISFTKQAEIVQRYSQMQEVGLYIFQQPKQLIEKIISWESYLLSALDCQPTDISVTASTKSLITAKKTAQTLELLHRTYMSKTGKTGLIGLFEDLQQGKNDTDNLFVGSDIKVNYSIKRGDFGRKRRNLSRRESNKEKSIPISPEEIIEMVETGQLLATTDAHAVVMLLASSKVPVVYHGNTYGFDKYMAEIAEKIGMIHTSGLMHFTGEWQDAWDLLILSRINPQSSQLEKTEPNLMSLALLLSPEQLQQLFQRTMQDGLPVTMSMDEFIMMLKQGD